MSGAWKREFRRGSSGRSQARVICGMTFMREGELYPRSVPPSLVPRPSHALQCLLLAVRTAKDKHLDERLGRAWEQGWGVTTSSNKDNVLGRQFGDASCKTDLDW